MSITSTAFGRVYLTGKDAKKFKSQVRYGRASAASRDAVEAGVKLSKQLDAKGHVTFKLKQKPKSK
ncbi:MAG: hypothetical protein U1E21_01445 [Reyranellaceae bacterium]